MQEVPLILLSILLESSRVVVTFALFCIMILDLTFSTYGCFKWMILTYSMLIFLSPFIVLYHAYNSEATVIDRGALSCVFRVVSAPVTSPRPNDGERVTASWRLTISNRGRASRRAAIAAPCLLRASVAVNCSLRGGKMQTVLPSPNTQAIRAGGRLIPPNNLRN